FSELQARLPGRFGERLHAAVILIAAAVEHHVFDALGARALRDELAHDFGSGDIAAALDLAAHVLIERTRGNKGQSLFVVDHLRAHVLARAVDAKTRTLRRARQLFAHAHVNPPAVHFAR